MSANLPTYGLDGATVTIRAAEVPAADFVGGMNKGGSCAPGVGINTGNIDPKLEDWSILDQAQVTRAPQLTQHIGGDALGDGNQDATVIQAVQGTDTNDTLTYITALAQAAPGVGFGAGNADPINRTGVTIEIGDRAWGTNDIA